jgi:hypothetical protein
MKAKQVVLSDDVDCRAWELAAASTFIQFSFDFFPEVLPTRLPTSTALLDFTSIKMLSLQLKSNTQPPFCVEALSCSARSRARLASTLVQLPR